MTPIERVAAGLGMYPDDVAGFARVRYGTTPLTPWTKLLVAAIRNDLDGPDHVRSAARTWRDDDDPEPDTTAAQ